MTHDTLVWSIQTTHDVLETRLETAIERHGIPDRPRDNYPAIDTFLATCSRHLAAMTGVLLPPATRHLADGSDRAHALNRRSRHLEVALAQVKARLYGSVYAAARPWSDVWGDVRREFDATMELEESLVAALSGMLDHTERHRLSDRLYRAEQRAPTRPHPYVPHLGVPGRVARQVCLRVDRFWDTAEGRMIPEPVKVHDRSHQGRLTQYLLADPHLDRS